MKAPAQWGPLPVGFSGGEKSICEAGPAGVNPSVTGADGWLREAGRLSGYIDTHTHTRPQTHTHTQKQTERQIDRLPVVVCVYKCGCCTSLRNLINFQAPLVSLQHPPHLISGLMGPCGSITGSGSPLQLCTHIHIHIQAITPTCTELCSSSFRPSRQSSPCGQVQSGPAYLGRWRGHMFVCVCVCVCVWGGDIMYLPGPSAHECVCVCASYGPCYPVNNITDQPLSSYLGVTLFTFLSSFLFRYINFRTVLFPFVGQPHRPDDVTTQYDRNPLPLNGRLTAVLKGTLTFIGRRRLERFIIQIFPCGPVIGTKQQLSDHLQLYEGDKTHQIIEIASLYILDT